MEGDGPISGEPIESGVLVFADDPVAADAVGASLMGFDPEQIPYISEAGRFLGQVDRSQIEQRAEDPERLAKTFTPPPRGPGVTAG